MAARGVMGIAQARARSVSTVARQVGTVLRKTGSPTRRALQSASAT
jgi:hypothetical protein